jgi:hypothetical protein
MPSRRSGCARSLEPRLYLVVVMEVSSAPPRDHDRDVVMAAGRQRGPLERLGQHGHVLNGVAGGLDVGLRHHVRQPIRRQQQQVTRQHVHVEDVRGVARLEAADAARDQVGPRGPAGLLPREPAQGHQLGHRRVIGGQRPQHRVAQQVGPAVADVKDP